MTITAVQRTGAVAAATTSPFTNSLNGTGVGNTIIALVAYRATGGSISFSDGVNTYQSRSYTSNGINNIAIFYCLSGLGGNLTFTTSYSTSITNIFASVREYSSRGLTFEGDAGYTATSTTAPSSNNLVTTGTNDLLVGLLIDINSQNSTNTQGAGWGHFTHNTDTFTPSDMSEDMLNQPPGTYAATFVLGTAENDWACAIAAFSEAAGAVAGWQSPTVGPSFAI